MSNTKTKEPTTLDDCRNRPAAASKWKDDGLAGVDGNGTPVISARFSLADLRQLLDILDDVEGDDETIDDLFERVLDMEEWLEARIVARAVTPHPTHRLEDE